MYVLLVVQETRVARTHTRDTFENHRRKEIHLTKQSKREKETQRKMKLCGSKPRVRSFVNVMNTE